MTLISPHFTLEEFTHSQTAARRGIDNTPKGQDLENVRKTSAVMEKVRTILGDHPILVSSGFRNQWVNSAVGGAKNSAHVHGLACDFTCPGFGTPIQICEKLKPHMVELGVDQLIHEYTTWVHLGLAAAGYDARHEALTIDTGGTRHGFA
jgi:hypothetical protein